MLGAQKNRLIEKVLLSTPHKYMFSLRNKIFLGAGGGGGGYALLTKGLISLACYGQMIFLEL